jgi:hypothetical protein
LVRQAFIAPTSASARQRFAPACITRPICAAQALQGCGLRAKLVRRGDTTGAQDRAQVTMQMAKGLLYRPRDFAAHTATGQFARCVSIDVNKENTQ